REFKVGIVCEAEFAVDSQTAQRRRTDVEDHVLAFFNSDLVACDWHLAAWPSGRIRPARLPDRRRTLLLSRLNNSKYAYKKKYWNEQCKKQRAICFYHGIDPRICMVTQNLTAKDSANVPDSST